MRNHITLYLTDSDRSQFKYSACEETNVAKGQIIQTVISRSLFSQKQQESSLIGAYTKSGLEFSSCENKTCHMSMPCWAKSSFSFIQ